MKHTITSVLPGGVAEELGVEPGDILLSVNEKSIRDVFDFRFETADDAFTMTVLKPDGEEWELEIELGEGEELGVDFEDGLMDSPKSCANRCVFCFIDQNPPGMRETIYFKDDDARLSFLRGNYVTLTNMAEADFERILRYRLSPINVSVHATDADLRRTMLGHKNAGDVLARIRRLCDAGIELNFQIVLCKGLNDGAALDESIGDLAAFLPNGRSLSVVPAGLTRHRDGLYPLRPFTREEAAAVVTQVSGWQKRLKKSNGTAFVYAADEFYLAAGLKLPPYEAYEGFPQLENGVGMLALEERDFETALAGGLPPCPPSKRGAGYSGARSVTLVTGAAAAGFVQAVADRLSARADGLSIRTVPVANGFFGEGVTVSGLLTGRDILAQLAGRDLGEAVYVPRNLLRENTETLLDDVTIPQMAETLGVPVIPLADCASLVHELIN